MGRLLFTWLVVFLAVFAMAALFPERIFYADWQAVAIFAAILGIFNTFLRPLINLLALPLNCLTFGLFAIVVNGFVFWLATQVFPGVTVATFWDAIIAALFVSLVSFVLSRLV